MSVILFLFLTGVTTSTVFAGGEEESGLSSGGSCSGYAVLRDQRFIIGVGLG